MGKNGAMRQLLNKPVDDFNSLTIQLFHLQQRVREAVLTNDQIQDITKLCNEIQFALAKKMREEDEQQPNLGMAREC
jgi:hypothetical protein